MSNNKSVEVHATVRDVLRTVRAAIARGGYRGGTYEISRGHVTVTEDRAGRVLYSVRRCTAQGWTASRWVVVKVRRTSREAAHGRAVALSLIGI